MTIKPWKTISSKVLIDDQWMTLRADSCRSESGVEIDPYYVQEHAEWVHVVAFNSDNLVLLNRQYRHAIGEVCLELPCGCVDEGESPLEAMQRELLEETGCKASSWETLPRTAPNPARFSNWAYPFIAKGVERVQAQSLDEVEEIEFEFYSPGEVLRMIEDGEFTQAIHLSSILLAFKKLSLY